MANLSPVTVTLAAVAVVAVISTVPYAATAIAYRRRDNGLAYLLFVSGVGVWNAMFVVQLLPSDAMVKAFFLALSVVGAVQAGLGWFLFSSTASSTSGALDRRVVYVLVSVLGGLDIVLAVTAPVHPLYWVEAFGGALEFVAITPAIGYWLHTLLLASLFGAGAWQFADAWRRGTNVLYSRAYTIGGLLTALAIIASNVAAPGGLSVAPLAAAGLTTIGWLQASRGRVTDRILARW